MTENVSGRVSSHPDHHKSTWRLSGALGGGTSCECECRACWHAVEGCLCDDCTDPFHDHAKENVSGQVLTHNELHQQLLEVWHTGNVGFLPHHYRRCPQSGAGNCCCGRDDRATLHQEGI